MMIKNTRAQHGFTLIELMIAMTILAMISIGIYDVTSGTFERRESVEAEGDFYNSLRVGLDVLGRDLTQLYSPQGPALPAKYSKDLAPPAAPSGGGLTGAGGLPGGVMPYNSEQANLGDATDFWNAAVDADGLRRSRFNGEETRMSFVSTSHVRIYRDSLESDLVKISYALEDPKSPDPNLVKGSKLLVKHESVDVFGDDQKERDSDVRMTLVENVKAVSFEYLDGDKDEWNKKWDTAGADHKDVFPAIVRVTIEVYQPGPAQSTLTVKQEYRPELNL
jgi:prepilin-type N-terminal cleavage/methylation domain-containing protein